MQTTVTTMGRVTADFELLTSQNERNTTYVQFNLAVNKGYGEKEHPNFYQCVLFGAAAERMAKAGVKKGSLITIVGDLDLVDFRRKEDGSKGTIAKINLYDWSYAPTNRPKTETDPNDAPTYAPTYGGFE
jgi:single-stranded DNA-binding protein